MKFRLASLAVAIISVLCCNPIYAQEKKAGGTLNDAQGSTENTANLIKQTQAVVEDSGSFETDYHRVPVHFSAKVDSIDGHSMFVSSKFSKELSTGEYEQSRSIEIVWQKIRKIQIEKEDGFDKSFSVTLTLESPTLITTSVKTTNPSRTRTTEAQEESQTVFLRLESRASATTLEDLISSVQALSKEHDSKKNLPVSVRIDSKELDSNLVEIRNFMSAKHAPLVSATLSYAKAGEYSEHDVADDIKRIDSTGFSFTRITRTKHWLTNWDGTTQTAFPETETKQTFELKWSDLSNTSEITDTVDGAGETVYLSLHIKTPAVAVDTATDPQAHPANGTMTELGFPVEGNKEQARKIRTILRNLIASSTP